MRARFSERTISSSAAARAASRRPVRKLSGTSGSLPALMVLAVLHAL